MLIIGEQEETSGLVAVKKRGGEDLGTISPEAFIDIVRKELAEGAGVFADGRGELSTT